MMRLLVFAFIISVHEDVFGDAYLIVQESRSVPCGEHKELEDRVNDLENAIVKIREEIGPLINKSEASEKACSDGWLVYGGSCYLFGRIRVNFQTAKEFCSDAGASLVKTETKAENEFLKAFMLLLKLDSGTDGFWLGLTESASDGKWRWVVDGSVAAYTDWNIGEPRIDRDEPCVVYYNGGQLFKWGDVDCLSSFRALCEKK